MKRLAWVLALTMIAGCSPSPRERMVGTWAETGSADNVLTFGESGSFEQVSYGQKYTGTWTLVKDDGVEVQFTGNSSQLGKTTIALSFDKDVLTTRNPGGRTQTWKKK